VADVFLSTGRHAVLREGSRRYQEVSADVEGRDPRSFAQEAMARIASDTKLPPGVRSELGGAAQARARGRRRMLLHSALAGASILLLLALVLRRPPSLVCLLAGLPFVISGGVLALLSAGGVLSLGSLAGLAALLGIAAQSAVVVVSRSERLVRVEGMPWNLETAILGASESLVPLLATACVTAAGLLPLALCPGPFGAPVHGPITIAILGGLATSAFLSLIVLPILLLRHGKLGGA
jgi:Cu/Ag efflux pump CusA